MASVDLISDHPVLLLFLVIGIGSAVGRLRIRGVGLGPAAVLFAGLAASGLDPELVLSEDVMELGLVLFTYTVGLATGPAFVAGLRGNGLRSLAVVAIATGAASIVAAGAGAVLDLGSFEVAGLFAGSTTNTPALGAVLDAAGPDGSGAAITYAIAYPAGVLVALLAASAALRTGPGPEPDDDIVAWAVLVTQDRMPLGLLPSGVSFGRCIRSGTSEVATPDTVVLRGDVVTVVGPA
ncbi:MAG TPA: transporter, partial [Acidimicrobiaceae bacterium]|nr:transporter [Acidimicrobiaceae bacterium]